MSVSQFSKGTQTAIRASALAARALSAAAAGDKKAVTNIVGHISMQTLGFKGAYKKEIEKQYAFKLQITKTRDIFRTINIADLLPAKEEK